MRSFSDVATTRVEAARTFAGFSRTTQFIMSISTLVIWGYGGYLVLKNPTGKVEDGVTVGLLVMFMALVAQFYSPLQELTNMTQQVQQATTSAQRVFEVLDTMPDMEDRQDAKLSDIDASDRVLVVATKDDSTLNARRVVVRDK